MSWEMLLLIAFIWTAVGFGVAYLFGRFARGVDDPESLRGSGSPLAVRFWRRFARRTRTRRLDARSVGNLAQATHTRSDR